MEERVILPFLCYLEMNMRAPTIVLKTNMVVVPNIRELGLLKAYNTMVV